MAQQFQYHWRYELKGSNGNWCTYGRRYKTEKSAIVAGQREMQRNIELGFAVTEVRAVRAREDAS
jgi:hypothetical protein